MAAVEANGKTVEEAIESALEELGAERDEVSQRARGA
jgi:predicted RNA-binding protein Jag